MADNKQKETGEVIKIEGNVVTVKMEQHGNCAGCGHKTVCFPVGRNRVLIARIDENAKVGDTVEIEFLSGPSIISSLLIFVGSVFIPLATWLIAEMLFKASLVTTIISSVSSLIVYWIFLFFLNRRLKQSGWFLPRAVKGLNLAAKPSESGS